jgi:gamma-glutamylputrescine oxidase
MSISKWLDQSASMATKSYDVVIIGAGIAGLSAAYWLQKKEPNLRIAILEKHRIGFGASGRNAGFVTCGSTEHFMKLEKDFGFKKAVEIWKFSEENHRLLLEEVIQGHGNLLDYRKTGSCTVAPTEERWQDYQHTLKSMRIAGINVHAVSPTELRNDYGVSGFAGGIHYEGDGYIDPFKLLQQIHQRLNVDMFEGTEVFAMGTTDSRDPIVATTTVRTDRGTFSASKVIVTVNAYLPLILPTFSQLVTPGRGQILMTEPLPAFVKGPCYLTQHLAYFRQLPTGELIVGGFRNLAREIENTYADETTTLIQGSLLKFVKDHFPLATEARVAYRWSGIMGFTPDGQMLLGAVKDQNNVHVMAGCSGHGLGLSFHAAKVFIESLDGRALPEHLDVRRFATMKAGQ